MLESAVGYLAAADYAEMPASTLGTVLLALECADAAGTVARGRALNAFDAKDGHEDDGQKTTGAWLANIGRVTRAEANGHRSWGKTVASHPLIAEAMGERLDDHSPVMSRSFARKLCTLTGKIPEPHRQDADKILATAARAGATLSELMFLAAEILARTAPPDDDGGEYPDGTLHLQTTLDGAGVLTGELSPECTAAVQAVLGALSARCGAEDDRTQDQRLHDGLYEAMRRLLGSELLPKKNSHSTQAVVHIGLADLLALPGASPLQLDWTARLAARWAGMRAASAEHGGGDGAAWITGPAAQGITCDAALFPLVTGDPDLGVLNELIKLCVDLDGHLHGDSDSDSGSGSDVTAPDQDTDVQPGGQTAGQAGQPADRAAHARRVEELVQEIIGKAAALLSGEAGLASLLRRNLLGDMSLGGPSLPLDVGDVDDIPWWIRRAVHTRDQMCRWPIGCGQPTWATEPHHVTHRADHGPTAVENLYDLCYYHHHILVHQKGWTIRTRPDGTLEATSPDGRVFTEHTRPPPRPG
ncbi:MAG: DUF222 domain-containing protein [Streptosporangiaceae bacterium]|nr:DUF222 domain-containing protein [Streptosporangiaceae bacterium]